MTKFVNEEYIQKKYFDNNNNTMQKWITNNSYIPEQKILDILKDEALHTMRIYELYKTKNRIGIGYRTLGRRLHRMEKKGLITKNFRYTSEGQVKRYWKIKTPKNKTPKLPIEENNTYTVNKAHGTLSTN